MPNHYFDDPQVEQDYPGLVELLERRRRAGRMVRTAQRLRDAQDQAAKAKAAFAGMGPGPVASNRLMQAPEKWMPDAQTEGSALFGPAPDGEMMPSALAGDSIAGRVADRFPDYDFDRLSGAMGRMARGGFSSWR